MLEYPILHTGGGTDGSATSQVNAKYDRYITKFGFKMATFPAVKAFDPSVQCIRYLSPMAYQMFGAADPYEPTSGIPFATTGASTDGVGAMFAGHWLYKAGTRTTSAITSSSTTVLVADATRLTVGQYACIYDNPPGGFGHAEHVKITSKSGSTIGIQRGFKSTAQSHASNSVIAEHRLGQGTSPELWSYNQSNHCPNDGNGKKFNRVMGEWLGAKYNYSTDYQYYSDCDGLIFDVDARWLPESGGAVGDCDNDLVGENGFINNANSWGAGLDVMYSYIRAAQPNIYLTGGIAQTWSATLLNGGQSEGYPAGQPAEGLTPDYTKAAQGQMNWMIALMSSYATKSPRYSEGECKRASKIYPNADGVYASTNKYFRTDFGICLLTGAAFGSARLLVKAPGDDVWYDEYSVNVTPGSPTYGQARAKTDYAGIIANKHWLGQPLAPRYRLYDEATFGPTKALLYHDFTSSKHDWTGKNVATSLDAGALKAGFPTVKSIEYTAANIKGAALSLTGGQWYTYSIRMKAGAHRLIRLVLPGNKVEKPWIVPDWKYYVYTVKPASTGTYSLQIDLGRDDTEYWIDDVRIFRGTAGIMRRNFQRGTVIVNFTDMTQVVNLEKTYLRIKGTQDPTINNGASVTSVTIAPWDTAFLVCLDPGP